MTPKPAPAAPPRKPSLLAPPPEREPAPGAGVAAAVYAVLALLYFLPAFLPGRQIFGTDFSNAGYFFQDYLSRSFAAGHLPRWVPFIYGGVPLFANPGSTYYPVRFLADWLLPVQGILPAIFVFQFFVAGWGMYLLGREIGARPWVALVGGLCFQWTGLLTSWVYAGHDGRVIVASFVPLFFYALHRGVRGGRVAPFALASAALGFALLSFQIQVAWYMLVGGLLWGLFSLTHLGTWGNRRLALRVIGLGVAAVALAFVMNAVNFLPFTGYVAASPRAGSEGRGYEYSVSYSMAAGNLLGVAVPEQVGASVQDPNTGAAAFPEYRGANGMKLHSEYLGAVVLVLLAMGAVYARRERYLWFFGGSALFFLTLALGGNTPLYRLYWAVLPGLKKFRAPDLAYSMVAFSLVVAALLGLEALARLREEAAARRAAAGPAPLARVPWIGGAVVVLAVLGAAALGRHAGPGGAAGWMRFAFFAAAATLTLWLWSARQMGPRAAMLALALITTADLWVIGKRFFYTLPGPGVMYAEDEVAAFLRAQPGPFRVFAVPGQSAWPRQIDYPMLYGIEQVGGEHGNQLQRYNEFVGEGQGSTPSYANLNDARFLQAANARYLVISAQLQDPRLREAYRGSEAIVYENPSALPRAYLVGEALTAPAGQTLALMRSERWDPTQNAVVESPQALALAGRGVRGSARVSLHDDDHVVVATESAGPALLVLADNYAEGWEARVDGHAAPIYRTNHTFRGVAVPAGRHSVDFRFDPPSLRTGFLLYLACLGLLALYGVFLLVSSRRRGDDVSGAVVDPAPVTA